eukprot:6479685-Pyramimonas_sp.AAC.1
MKRMVSQRGLQRASLRSRSCIFMAPPSVFDAFIRCDQAGPSSARVELARTPSRARSCRTRSQTTGRRARASSRARAEISGKPCVS